MFKAVFAFAMVVLVIVLAYLLYLVKSDNILVDKADKFHVSVIMQSDSSPFWKEVASGAKSVKYPQLTVTVEGPAQETDFAKQASLIDAAVAQKVDAIVVAPHNASAVTAALQRARAAKIPVVMIDTYLDIGEGIPFVSSDNERIGELAAEGILQSGRVSRAVVIRGSWGDESHDQRSAAAIKTLRDAGVEIVAYENADSNREKAYQVAKNLLSRYKGIQAIFATNDEMALGVSDAEREANYPNNLYIVGVDAIPLAIESVKKGFLDATVSQNPYEIGRAGVETAINIIKKNQVPERSVVPSKLITTVNVNNQ